MASIYSSGNDQVVADLSGNYNPYGQNTQPKGAYWRGNDGNVYVKGAEGVNSAGAWDDNTDLYWGGMGYQAINNPGGGQSLGATNSITAGGSGSGGGDAGELASLDRSEGRLRALYGQADTQLNQGLQSLTNSYTGEQNKLNTGRTRTLEGYDTQGQQAVQKRDEGIGKVDTNARTLNDSLRRLLGMAGGSKSSAFQFAAPNAVAREASQGRQGVIGDYAQDAGALDKARKYADEDYTSALDELLTSKNQREQALRSGIEQQRGSIDQQLGDIAARRSGLRGGSTQAQIAAAQPYEDQYNSREQAINNLFAQFNPNVAARAVNPQSVDLSQYQVDRGAINANRQTGQNNSTSPYSNFLRKQLEEQA
jgi:hypothetical protein